MVTSYEKKWMIGLMAILLVVSICGCSNKKNENIAKQGDTQDVKANQETDEESNENETKIDEGTNKKDPEEEEAKNADHDKSDSTDSQTELDIRQKLASMSLEEKKSDS